MLLPVKQTLTTGTNTIVLFMRMYITEFREERAKTRVFIKAHFFAGQEQAYKCPGVQLTTVSLI